MVVPRLKQSNECGDGKLRPEGPGHGFVHGHISTNALTILSLEIRRPDALTFGILLSHNIAAVQKTTEIPTDMTALRFSNPSRTHLDLLKTADTLKDSSMNCFLFLVCFVEVTSRFVGTCPLRICTLWLPTLFAASEGIPPMTADHTGTAASLLFQPLCPQYGKLDSAVQLLFRELYASSHCSDSLCFALHSPPS